MLLTRRYVFANGPIRTPYFCAMCSLYSEQNNSFINEGKNFIMLRNNGNCFSSLCTVNERWTHEEQTMSERKNGKVERFRNCTLSNVIFFSRLRNVFEPKSLFIIPPWMKLRGTYRNHYFCPSVYVDSYPANNAPIKSFSRPSTS